MRNPGVTAGGPDVRRRLYALAFVDEFAPLYALFTLWFVDNEVTTPQISIAFVIWAALAVALELPSGALADRVDRRKLIASAFVLRAAGIAVWLVWPTLTGLVIGAVLWAVHDAAASGAWEALIHDQLDAVGQQADYGIVIARVGQFTNVGLAAGTLAASGLVRLGLSIDAVGWAHVAVHAGSIAIVLALPDVRWVAAQDRPENTGAENTGAENNGAAPSAGHQPSDAAPPSSWAAWWMTLCAGLTAIRQQPDLYRLAMVGAGLGGLFVVDEYIPLLARDRGASDAAVPLIVGTVWLGLIVGGEVAARRPRITSLTLASAMLAGTAVMAMVIALDTPWALLAIALGYGAVETTWVISDARFQAAAPRATRATVTSVRGLGEGVIAGLAFLLIALRSEGNDPTPGLHWVVGLLALVSFLVWKWVPDRSTTDPQQSDE